MSEFENRRNYLIGGYEIESERDWDYTEEENSSS